MDTIKYTSQDETLEIKLEYIVKRQLHVYPGFGKNYPKHTQCILYINGLVHAFGEVVKHQLDEDNQEYAYKIATTRALSKLSNKYLRKKMWDIFFEKISKETL